MTPRSTGAAASLLCLGVAAALALPGCAADDGFGATPPRFDQGEPPRPDQGPGCPADQVALSEGVCVPTPAPTREAVCPFVREWFSACEDADGDCFVAPDCPMPAALVGVITDCDDSRPRVHPDAPELCNAIDDNCDGQADEAFPDIGRSCEACGVTGKLECAAGGGEPALACSSAPGQSGADTAPVAPEVCNGLDDDCDGQIDEACALGAAEPEISRHTPAVCSADRVLLVEAGAVVAWRRDGDAWTAQPLAAPEGAGPAHHLRCRGEVATWLAGGDCSTPPDGPLRCTGASVLMAVGDAPAVDLTGATSPGPPAIGPDGRVWWHVVLDGSPRLTRTAAEGPGLERPAPDSPLSDPTPGEGDTLFAREWTEGVPDVVWLEGGFAQFLGGRPGRPEAPAADGAWLVWPFDGGASLWAVSLNAQPIGLQITTGPGPHAHPQVQDERVLWVDGDTLRALDLRTGVDRAVATGLARPTDFSVGAAGALAWIETDADGAAQLRLATP